MIIIQCIILKKWMISCPKLKKVLNSIPIKIYSKITPP